MTLDQIFKKKQEADAAKEKSRVDIVGLERQLDTINAQAEAAAAAGLEDEYIQLTDKASEISRRIYVKQKVVNSPPLGKEISESEVATVWKEHAAKYKKTYDQKYEKFEQLRKKLCAVYADLIEDQRQILLDRKKLAESFPLPANVATPVESRFPFKHLPLAEKKAINGIESGRPDINCYGLTFRDFLLLLFYGCDDIDRDTVQAWSSIVECNNQIIPEKQYRPKTDPGPVTLGLYRGK